MKIPNEIYVWNFMCILHYDIAKSYTDLGVECGGLNEKYVIESAMSLGPF